MYALLISPSTFSSSPLLEIHAASDAASYSAAAFTLCASTCCSLTAAESAARCSCSFFCSRSMRFLSYATTHTRTHARIRGAGE